MNRSKPVSGLITWLGKLMNVVLLLVCGAATGWAAQLYWVRRAMPYDALGNYYNPQTRIRYSAHIVPIAGSLALLFGAVTLLLLFSAYRLYVMGPRRRSH